MNGLMVKKKMTTTRYESSEFDLSCGFTNKIWIKCGSVIHLSDFGLIFETPCA